MINLFLTLEVKIHQFKEVSVYRNKQILWRLFLKFLNYYLVFLLVILGMEPKALRMLDKCLPTELCPQLFILF